MKSPTKPEKDTLEKFLACAKEELPSVQVVTAERIKGFGKRLLVGLRFPGNGYFTEEQAESMHYLAASMSIEGEIFVSLSLDDEVTDGEKLDIGFLSQQRQQTTSNVLPFVGRYGRGLAISGACAAAFVLLAMNVRPVVEQTTSSSNQQPQASYVMSTRPKIEDDSIDEQPEPGHIKLATYHQPVDSAHITSLVVNNMISQHLTVLKKLYAHHSNKIAIKHLTCLESKEAGSNSTPTLAAYQSYLWNSGSRRAVSAPAPAMPGAASNYGASYMTSPYVGSSSAPAASGATYSGSAPCPPPVHELEKFSGNQREILSVPAK